MSPVNTIILFLYSISIKEAPKIWPACLNLKLKLKLKLSYKLNGFPKGSVVNCFRAVVASFLVYRYIKVGQGDVLKSYEDSHSKLLPLINDHNQEAE